MRAFCLAAAGLCGLAIHRTSAGALACRSYHSTRSMVGVRTST